MADLDSMNLGQLQELMTDLEALAKAGAILTKAGMNPVFSLAPGRVATISTGAVLVEGAPPVWVIEDDSPTDAHGPSDPVEAVAVAQRYRQNMQAKKAAAADEVRPITILSNPAFEDSLTATLVDLAMPAPETPQSPPPESVCAPGPGIDAPPAGPSTAGGAASPDPIPSPQLVVSSPTGPGGGAPPAKKQAAGGKRRPAEEYAFENRDPFLIHWFALPDDGWTPEQDLELMELVCADWMWPELTVELGREKKALLKRYDQLTGLYVDDATGKQARRFTRERVLAGLQAAVPVQAA